MKKTLLLLVAALVLLLGTSPAMALQSGYGYAELDLTSLSYDGVVAAKSLGTFSKGVALALDQDEIAADGFAQYYCNSVLDDWAEAYTSAAFANAATRDGLSFSEASAKAGDGYGNYSGAFAATKVTAFEFLILRDGDITINIDYYLESAVSGDEPGFSVAGAGAMLGIYEYLDSDTQGRWLTLDGGIGKDFNAVDDTLEVTLSVKAGTLFKVFAGTAAYAAAFVKPASVPEPATFLLIGTGLLGLAGLSRRRFR